MTNVDRSPARVLCRFDIDGHGVFIGPRYLFGVEAIELVVAGADRRGVVADGQPVQDPADARGGR